MPIVINPQLAQHIEEMEIHKYNPSNFLFGLKKDGFMPGPKQEHRNKYTEVHSKALKDCDLYNGELTLYSWKHTGNCNAYRAGVDIYSLMTQNRHASLDQTENYLRSMGMRISKELKNLEW